jgi:ribosomal silencing factor RsfS
MTSQPAPAADHFHDVLDICEPYVVGVFDLSDRGGPERTIVVRARSAAHVRKLATRVGDLLGASPEGEAPDGSDPWLVVDGDHVVTHLMTDGSLHRYGLLDLFGERSARLDDVFAVTIVERLQQIREEREAS